MKSYIETQLDHLAARIRKSGTVDYATHDVYMLYQQKITDVFMGTADCPLGLEMFKKELSVYLSDVSLLSIEDTVKPVLSQLATDYEQAASKHLDGSRNLLKQLRAQPV